MKKTILKILCCLLLVSVTVALAGCFGGGTEQEDEEDKKPQYTETDGFGYGRPSECWITDCLLIGSNSYPNPSDLFGESGESGIISEEADSEDGLYIYPPSEYSYTTSYLVCLVYGDVRAETIRLETYLKFTMISEGQVYTDEECVNVKNSVDIRTITGETDYNFDMTKSADGRLSISATPNMGKYQACIIVPFTPKKSGTLFADLRVECPTVAQRPNYSVDEYSTATVSEGKNEYGNVNVDSFTAKYLTADKYNFGQFSESDLMDAPAFGSDVTNYVVMDFEISASEDNDGRGSINAMIRLPEAWVLDATIEEAPTGKIEESVVDDVTRIYASYKVPASASERKSVRMIVRLKPLNEGVANLDIFLTGAENTVTSGKNYLTVKLVSGSPTILYTLDSSEEFYIASRLWDQNLAEITIPDEYAGLPVKRLEGLFRYNTRIQKLTIGNNIGYLGDYAFEGCTALREITLSNGMSSLSKGLFKNCTSLETVTLPEGLKKIPEGTFESCSRLREINNLASITEVGANAFSGCKAITELNFNNLTNLGAGCFSDCTSLKKITGHKGTTIKEGVFENCTSLENFDFTGIQRIERRAFANCKSFTEIILTYDCKYIAEGAFTGTSSVRTLNLGNAFIDGFENHAFDLTSLEVIEVSPTSPNYKASGNCLLSYNGNIVKLGTKNSKIPDGVSYIDQYAFEGCVGLTGIVIPDGVVEISRGAFRNCTSLTQIELPDSVTQIWQYAFYGCKSLTSVKLDFGSWYIADGPGKNYVGEAKTVSSASTAAQMLTGQYSAKYFIK